MNFYAHAILSAETGACPRFVLGSMVPDFATMVGSRLPRFQDPVLQAGVDHHQAVDRVFHTAPLFLQHMRRVGQAAEQTGVPSSSSEAIGHIGVELLLDGWLSELCPEHLPSYHAAVDLLALHAELPTLAPHDKLLGLRGRLQSIPLPQAYSEPQFVLQVLARILDKYPTMRFSSHTHPALVQVLTEAKRTLASDALLFLSTVRQRLAQKTTTPSRTAL